MQKYMRIEVEKIQLNLRGLHEMWSFEESQLPEEVVSV